MVSRLGYSEMVVERTDALTAFLTPTWWTPREARRTFGDALPDVPPEAFAGRTIGRRLSRWGPRNRAGTQQHESGRAAEMTDEQRRWLFVLVAAIVGGGLAAFVRWWLG